MNDVMLGRPGIDGAQDFQPGVPSLWTVLSPRSDGRGVARGVGAVAEQVALSFADLLRQLRAQAKLTQEELAEAATLSPRSVSDLERGINRTAHKTTAVLLADALGLSGQAGELFVAAARGKIPALEVLAAVRGAGGSPLAAGRSAYLAQVRDIAPHVLIGRENELAEWAVRPAGCHVRPVTQQLGPLDSPRLP